MYDWSQYSVRIELGPECAQPLSFKRKARRWLYPRVRWQWLFEPGDWLTERQWLLTAERETKRQMRQMLGEPGYSLGGPKREAP